MCNVVIVQLFVYGLSVLIPLTDKSDISQTRH